jgi:hypothetical protein
LTVVIVNELEVAGEPVKQGVALEVITTLTTSPLLKEVVVYVALSLPTSEPFNFHWYEGALPPLVGVAVNVTEVPEQIVLSASLDAIDTLAVCTELIVIEAELFALISETQPLRIKLIVIVVAPLLVILVVVNVPVPAVETTIVPVALPVFAPLNV